jgi:hypothetical protein
MRVQLGLADRNTGRVSVVKLACTIVFGLFIGRMAVVRAASEGNAVVGAPADAIVINVSQAASPRPPFVLRDDPSAANGKALFLPKGTTAPQRRGGATFNFSVPAAGTYHAWVHALWQDQCSDSATIRVDAFPDQTVGQDHVYGSWHWVKAGQFNLPAGDHNLLFIERETGIAVDQFLLTQNTALRPAGAFTSTGMRPDIRRFADDFSRSPGHGLESWKPVSGKWEIAFTFDPNRTPSQYSLSGKATDGRAVISIDDPPWSSCRISFSVFPVSDGSFGAMLEPADASAAPLALQFDLADRRASVRASGKSLDAKCDLGNSVRVGQWHRVVIERYGRIFRASVDDSAVVDRNDAPPGNSAPGLFIANGEALFDDVQIEGFSLSADGPADVKPPPALGPGAYVIGPYHFSETHIEDPSDYLDFTSEEYRTMAKSPDADKLRREKKYMPVVSSSYDDYGPWSKVSGQWLVNNGMLSGTGPNAVLSHWQEVIGDTDVRTRVRLTAPDSAAEIALFASARSATVVRIVREKSPSIQAAGALTLPVADGNWHELFIRAAGDGLSVSLDGQAGLALPRVVGLGGEILLKVPTGRADFDDVEFTLPRQTAHGRLHAFDRRETDWWREGEGWSDHGGIACVLASNWISLVAPRSRGMLWNKRRFSGDVALAVDVEENSEWFGWNRNPSHTHYPYDNVVLQLAPEGDRKDGYRLEVNSRNRSATVLYRGTMAVAEAPQDSRFPIRYLGGDAPYRPRRSRVGLMKQGSRITAVVNGKVVLQYDDPTPLEVAGIGVGGYNTRLNICQVEVREFAKP